MLIFIVKNSLHITLFIVSLFGFNVIIETIFPPIIPNYIQNRILYYQDNHKSIDHIYIGSSVTRRGFNTSTYKRQLKKRGYLVEPCNFGIEGLSFEEGTEILKILLDGPHDNLQLVMTDVSIEPYFEVSNWFVHRSIWWHTPKATLNAAQSVYLSTLPLNEKSKQIVGHSIHMLIRSLHIGYIKTYIQNQSFTQTKVHHQGFQSLDSVFSKDPEPSIVLRKFIFDSFQDFYIRDLDKLQDLYKKNSDSKLNLLPNPYKNSVKAHLNLLKEHDIDNAYVLMPHIQFYQAETSSHFQNNFLEFDNFRFIDLSDPNKYPTLFSPTNFFDFVHLNEQGANIFSTLLADAVIKIL